MRFPQFFDQAFHMPGNRRGILLGIFQSGDQTENGVIHAGDGEGRAGFSRFDAAGQLVECVLGLIQIIFQFTNLGLIGFKLYLIL